MMAVDGNSVSECWNGGVPLFSRISMADNAMWKGKIRALIILTNNLNRGVMEDLLQLSALLVEVIKVRGISHRQLVQAANIPATGQ